MSYQCQECGYKGRSFTGGVCPACGSYKVKSGRPIKQTEARKPYRLALSIALWIYLAYALANKLL